MRALRVFTSAVVTGAVIAAVHACDTAPQPDDGAVIDPAVAADLAALKEAVAGFDDVEVARAAGYTEQITPCWYHSDRGAQGIHIARPDLIDNAVSLLEPELVMYDQRPDGSMRFLAVEYIIPFTAWSEPDAPQMLGQPFVRNERLELWVLHVWLGRPNPSGLFADWSPDVTCNDAPDAEDRAT